jgi:hypothetical protein
MGRKPLGNKPMTAAQRQQRRRDRRKAAMPAAGTWLRLIDDIDAFIQARSDVYYSSLSESDVTAAVEIVVCRRRLRKALASG